MKLYNYHFIHIDWLCMWTYNFKESTDSTCFPDHLAFLQNVDLYNFKESKDFTCFPDNLAFLQNINLVWQASLTLMELCLIQEDNI
jgi:hypothetical protein